MVQIDKKNNLYEIIYNSYLTGLKRLNNSSNSIDNLIYSLKYLVTNKSYLGFTRTNGIRQNMEETFDSIDECISIILKSYVEKLLKEPPIDKEEKILYNAVLETYKKYGIGQAIFAIKKVIVENSYMGFCKNSDASSKINFRNILQNNVVQEKIIFMVGRKIAVEAIDEVSKQYEEKYQEVSQRINEKNRNEISSFIINPNTYNLCREHILKGNQFNYNKMDYTNGKDLYASTDVGNVRQNQEDSVIILQHPKNPDFKMLVVADGAGGCAKGEVASSYITKDITEWFENISPQYYDARYISNLQYELNKRIEQINCKLFSKYRNSALSTFVGAIVTDKQTLVTNVGDSRAYIYADGELKQITEDDSFSYKWWKASSDIGKGQRIPDKDAVRFHKDSNKITKAVGTGAELYPSSTIISNDLYQTLMLFSDGITDCLSDDQIKAITKFTPRDVLSRSLIENAKVSNSGRRDLDPRFFNQFIKAGKDNATVAILDKREDEER